MGGELRYLEFARTVADGLEAWIDETGIDGFNVAGGHKCHYT